MLIHVLFNFLANLKRLCDTEAGLNSAHGNVKEFLRKHGLATQCINANNASDCKDMCLKQLCLKINAKLGGINNVVRKNEITRYCSLVFAI